MSVFENRVLRGLFGLRGTRRHRSGENYIMRSLVMFLLTRYLSGDQIEKN
jgi:hypothetical protein